MHLNDLSDLANIAKISHFTICVLPKNLDFPRINNAIEVNPNEKNHISVEQVHGIEQLVRTKQTAPITIVINHAEKMTEQAQNCFLKLLEEPGERIHFVFLTNQPQSLLPTIHSRAHIFTIKNPNKISSTPSHDQKTIALAKKYIASTPRDLVDLSTTLAKDREKALEIIDCAIELLFKSYFKTANQKFLDKLQKLLETHKNISNNGHIRLQLVAGMI